MIAPGSVQTTHPVPTTQPQAYTTSLHLFMVGISSTKPTLFLIPTLHLYLKNYLLAMKSNKLKGLTLMETVLYIGLTAVVMMIVVPFMLSTQESSLRTTNRVVALQSSSFVIQHIQDTFSKTLSINTTNTVFNNDSGVLSVMLKDGENIYRLENSRIYYNSIPITPNNVQVRKMYLEPVTNRKNEVVATRVTIEISSIGKYGQTETNNFLAIIR